MKTEPCTTTACGFWHNRPLAVLARLGVAIPFIYLAVMKLKDPPTFLKSLNGYHVVPTEPAALINALAIYMPWTELLVGICLLVGFLPRGAALVALTMLVVFTAAVFWRGLGMMSEQNIPFTEVKFDCGCGTGVVKLWSKLLSNGALILGAFYLLVTRARLWQVGGFENRPTAAAPAYAADL